MIPLDIDNVKVNFATHWGEITFGQYRGLEKATDIKSIASVMVGFDASDSLASRLAPFMTWLEVPFNPTTWTLPKKVTIKEKEIDVAIDIKTKTFAQKILLQRVKSKELDKALALYYQPIVSGRKFDYDKAMELLPEIEKLKLCDVYCIADYLFKQLKVVLEMEKKELSVPPTSEQIRAGINMFDVFGVNNTIDALAGGDILKYEKVLKLNYNTVFLKLKRTKLEGKYRKNYEKIMQSK